MPAQHRRGGADGDDLRKILRLAGQVLQSMRDTDPWLRGHDDARLRAGYAGLPRSARADDLSVLELLRRLAQVPDVAVGVLRVPVVGVLHEFAVGRDGVSDHSRSDPHHLARTRQYSDADRLAAAAVYPVGADPVREVR